MRLRYSHRWNPDRKSNRGVAFTSPVGLDWNRLKWVNVTACPPGTRTLPILNETVWLPRGLLVCAVYRTRHDLRREGISRLFEMGYQIHEVALFSGHKDWKQLARYTQLRAGKLRRLTAASSTPRPTASAASQAHDRDGAGTHPR